MKLMAFKPDTKELIKVLELIDDLDLDEKRAILDHLSDSFDLTAKTSEPDIAAMYFKALDCIDEGSLRLSRLLNGDF